MGSNKPLPDVRSSPREANQHWSASLCLPVALSILAVHPAVRYFGLSDDSSLLQSSLWRFIVLDTSLPGLLPSFAFALLAYAGTVTAVGACRETFLQRGFKGRDLLKPGSAEFIPESLGLPASCIYLLALVLFIPFRYYFSADEHRQRPQTTSRDGGWIGDISGRSGFPHHELATYLSALLSLLSSQILGFCDDVFDIRWRFKMPIPLISSIPMLLVYYAGRGGTGLVVPGWPAWLRQTVGSNVVDLGILYYVYMAMLSTFCTHSINILAGINGVEVGQALIIAASLCINDALYLPLREVLSLSNSPQAGLPQMVPVSAPTTSQSWISWLHWPSTATPLPPAPVPSFSPIQSELVSRHLFSLSIMLPLVGTCAGLLAWNRHPSRVFVGDTFCYFAGQALACAGVLGHFSKTLLLFFIPQVFNFLLSCPQLFGFVPCPRHRVPKVHPETMALYPSLAVFPDSKPAGTLGLIMLRILEVLGFVILYRESDLGPAGTHNGVIATTNLTILNTILVVSGVRTPIEHVRAQIAQSPVPPVPPPKGPKITEASLWKRAMAVQLLGSFIAFAIRYWAAAIVFPDQ